MYTIIDKRGTGKTSRLLLLAKENNGIIICQNPPLMQKKAYGYGITGIDFMSYEQYICTDINNLTKPVYIDELDLFLKTLDTQIDGYTLSQE